MLGFWIPQRVYSIILVIFLLLYSSQSLYTLFHLIMNMTLLYSIILDMTLLYLLIFLIILFLVYYDYMLGIASLDLYSNICSYSARSLISWVGGRHYVGIVPISCLIAFAPYVLAHVVDRGGDIPIESSVVHPLNVVLSVDTNYGEKIARFLIFLSNFHMYRYNLLLL